jgi:LysR family transcriptional regulator, positive regulator for ilvC
LLIDGKQIVNTSSVPFLMDIRELKLFRHLADSLHFGRTSQACNITPSGLTRSIRRLEAELNRQLFLRDNRSVALTPAGEIFRDYAEDAIQRWDELQSSLSADSVLRGDLSLYCSVTAILSIIPEILGSFRQNYPEVHINLQTGDAAIALAKLQSGEVDITIAALPDKKPPQLEFIKIIETPLIVIASVRFPQTIIYCRDGTVDWQVTPLIVAERGLSRTRADRWFAEKKINPNIYAQVAGNEAIITMVSIGCGAGIIPALVLDKSPLQDQVIVLDTDLHLEPFSVGVCTIGKNRINPIVQAFWKNVEEGRKKYFI